MLSQQSVPYLSNGFLDRVRAAYTLAINARTGDIGKIWCAIGNRQADIHAALMKSTNDDLRRIFTDPITTDLYFGVDSLTRTDNGQKLGDAQFALRSSSYRREDLISLARATETVPADESVAFDNEVAFGRLDQVLVQRVQFPSPFLGDIGFQTSRGVATLRAIQALYQTWLLLGLSKSSSTTVIEIGPGIGRTAYYSFIAGITDTVDLPMGIVGQACFLGATLGPDKIWFEGEKEAEAPGRIKLLSLCPDRMFDVAFNADSLTEMPLAVARGYASWINSHAGIFLSINRRQQEFIVGDIAKLEFATSFKSHRACPLRPDYTEEIFHLRSGAADRVTDGLTCAIISLKLLSKRLLRQVSHMLLPIWCRNRLRGSRIRD
jgi:hypothetical protein